MKKINNTNTAAAKAAAKAAANTAAAAAIVDRVKYAATKHKITYTKSGNAKDKRSAFVFVVRVKAADGSTNWQTIAEHAQTLFDCEKYAPFMGTFNADKAAAAFPAALSAFGLDIPISVKAAAAEAQKRLDAAADKKEAKEREFVANGIEAARADGSDKAAARWERLAEKYPDATTGILAA